MKAAFGSLADFEASFSAPREFMRALRQENPDKVTGE
jgi:hypothetical protein